MNRTVKILLALFLTLASAFAASAQVSFQSYDPKGDAEVCARMRAKMALIRGHRPTVALVLSGGGAKGSAHVGALKYLEEVGIPVDMVLGTSMGGLIGGLYSVGYSPSEIETLLGELDWSLILSDKIPQEFKSYEQKKYKEKYALSVPFYYAKDDSFVNRRTEETYPESDGQLHLGADDEEAEKSLRQNLFGSLPSGYIFGHNVNNVFSRLTVGYQDNIDFTELPIPFFCIAAEMVSGKAYLWHEGKLNTALRSTMSIPGIFAPVRTDGMILVDGGVRNNYPTDIAKAMGADIVIGVELSDADMTYSDINNAADLAWQFVDILGRDSFERNVGIPDVTIKPDLKGFNMMSFDPTSVATIIGRGYEAAKSKEDELMAIKKLVGPDTVEFQNAPAVNFGETPIVISGIRFEGVNPDEEEYLLDKLDIKVYDRVLRQDVEDAVATVFATKSFDYVNYELLNDDGSYVLNIKCKKGPSHQIGVGGRFDSESMVSAIVNLGFNVHRIEGSSLEFTAKVASNPYLSAHYAYKIARLPTVNADVKGAYTDVNLYNIGPAPRLNFKYWQFSQRLYFSDLNWKKADLKIGISNDLFNVTSLLSTDYIPEEYDLKNLKDDYVSAFVEARSDSFDNGYYPSRGHNVGFSYKYVLGGADGSHEPVNVFSLDASKCFRAGDVVAVIPTFRTRLVLAKDIPLAFMNVAGGSMKGKYMEQQMPFMGISYATPLSNKMWLLGTTVRFQLTKNNYLSLVANMMKDSDDFDSDLLWTGFTSFGAGVEYGYNTIIGPIKANVHWSNITRSVGAYLGIGFDF